MGASVDSGKSLEAVSGTGVPEKQFPHVFARRECTSEKTAGRSPGLRRAMLIAKDGSPSHANCTVAAVIRSYAYRCGGSDGITPKKPNFGDSPSSRLIPWLSSQKDTCRLAVEIDPSGRDCQAAVIMAGIALRVFGMQQDRLDVFKFAPVT